MATGERAAALGAKLRRAARENKLGNADKVYKAHTRHASRDQVDAGVRKLIELIGAVIEQHELAGNGVKDEPEEQYHDGKGFLVLQLEMNVVNEDEDEGFGGGFDDATEDDGAVMLLPHCAVEIGSGDVYGVDAAGEPAWDEGVRANVLDEGSLKMVLNPKTGKLHFFGGTVVELVYALAVDVNSANAFGETALMQAARSGHLDLCKWLVKGAGADPNCASVSGATALMVATERGSEQHVPLIQFLVQEGGANINQQNAWGVTALHLAAFRGNLACAKLLLKLGADRSLKDARGKVAADYTHESTSFQGTDGERSYNDQVEALLVQ